MWPDIEKLPDNLRLIVIDGRSVSVPGAAGTSYRLHLAMDRVTLSFIHVEVTDQYAGESLNHYPLTKNDVVLRLSPHALCRCINPVAIKSLICTKYSSTQSDEITVPVWLTNKKQEPVNGWAHARHLPPGKAGRSKTKVSSELKKWHTEAGNITLC